MPFKLKYANVCRVCHLDMPVGTDAAYVGLDKKDGLKHVVCPSTPPGNGGTGAGSIVPASALAPKWAKVIVLASNEHGSVSFEETYEGPFASDFNGIRTRLAYELQKKARDVLEGRNP